MMKLNIVARSTWIPLKSNNIGIKMEGGHVCTMCNEKMESSGKVH